MNNPKADIEWKQFWDNKKKYTILILACDKKN